MCAWMSYPWPQVSKQKWDKRCNKTQLSPPLFYILVQQLSKHNSSKQWLYLGFINFLISSTPISDLELGTKRQILLVMALRRRVLFTVLIRPTTQMHMNAWSCITHVTDMHQVKWIQNTMQKPDKCKTFPLSMKDSPSGNITHFKNCNYTIPTSQKIAYEKVCLLSDLLCPDEQNQ